MIVLAARILQLFLSSSESSISLSRAWALDRLRISRIRAILQEGDIPNCLQTNWIILLGVRDFFISSSVRLLSIVSFN
jgi:hypothetical protein